MLYYHEQNYLQELIKNVIISLMNRNNNKKERARYITHSIELLFWLAIVFLAVSFSVIKYIHNEKNAMDYQIFLNDADGLIVGSPVRMMGIEVGYITKIKPVKNEVYVKFIITKPDVYVPKGSVVTVEFSGMAGSKSLEIYVPDKKPEIGEHSDLMTVESPKRLYQAIRVLGDMYDKINQIIYTSSSFGKKLDGVKEYSKETFDKKSSNIDTENFIKYSNNVLDNSFKQAEDFKIKLETFKKLKAKED